MAHYEFAAQLMPGDTDDPQKAFVRLGKKEGIPLEPIQIRRLLYVDQLLKGLTFIDVEALMGDQPTFDGKTCVSLGIDSKEAEAAYLFEASLEIARQSGRKLTDETTVRTLQYIQSATQQNLERREG